MGKSSKQAFKQAFTEEYDKWLERVSPDNNWWKQQDDEMKQQQEEENNEDE